MVLLAACDQPPEAAREEAFEEEFVGFSEAYGEGKADIFSSLGIDPCVLLEPVLHNTEDFMRSGFVFGGEIEVSTGVAKGIHGRDIVWDFYHHQLTVSRYRGAGVMTQVSLAGGAATGYIGPAFNFERGVADWYGYFVTAGGSIGFDLNLPFIGEVSASITPSFYVSGEDDDGDGLIAPSEITYPAGPYGFSIGLSAAHQFVPVPDIVPFIEGSLSLSEGYWAPDHQGIREVYDELQDGALFGVLSVEASLVDRSTGESCLEHNPDWPEHPGGVPELDCIIELGDPLESHTKRGVDTAVSLCELTGRCALPLTWPIASTGIAIGFARDLETSAGSYCAGED